MKPSDTEKNTSDTGLLLDDLYSIDPHPGDVSRLLRPDQRTTQYLGEVWR